MSAFSLTEDQQLALEAITRFLANPIETVFVLSGYSGTGKSTLVKYLLQQLPGILNTIRMVSPKFPYYDVQLTATTNKAAENFALITREAVRTIHSFLGLRVETDYISGMTRLVPHRRAKGVSDTILVIDEASYIDSALLDMIFKLTSRCKILFIGDPAQLTPVKSSTAPVFNSNFAGASLGKVVRQAEGNPIIELSAKFRETVNTGNFFSFVPDGMYVRHMDRDTFNNEALQEFTRHNWKYHDSKILAWTNRRVVEYNHWLTGQCKGTPHLQEGDYAICNHYMPSRQTSIKTDESVYISHVEDQVINNGVLGQQIQVNRRASFFMPYSLADRKRILKQAQANGDYALREYVHQTWIDLRAAFASTINKAQGSTYDKVFIDLDDIKGCISGNQIARMLYVAVSRARYQVFLTGDLV